MPEMKLMIEQGPKGRRVVGFAPDWPGLERSAKTETELLDKLRTYFPRYAKVAVRAGQEAPFLAQQHKIVSESYPGNTSTDYWGVSFVPAAIDKLLLSPEAWERKLALLQAAWAEFDSVAAHVSAELQRGPRGGGRMRDEIIGHTWMSEVVQTGAKLGLDSKYQDLLNPEGLARHRAQVIAGFRAFHKAGKLMVGRSWTLPYLLRHAAYHILDHAWEMEDKDLSPQKAATPESLNETSCPDV